MSELLNPGEVMPLTRELRDRKIAERLAYFQTLIPQPVYAQPLVEPVAGRTGYQDLIRGTQPAAGQSFTYLVPGDMTLRPLSVMCQLATSGAAGDRTVTLEYQDEQQVRFLVAGTQAAVAASQTQGFCWHPLAGGVAWPIGDVAIAPLPQAMLYPHTRARNQGRQRAGGRSALPDPCHRGRVRNGAGVMATAVYWSVFGFLALLLVGLVGGRAGRMEARRAPGDRGTGRLVGAPLSARVAPSGRALDTTWRRGRDVEPLPPDRLQARHVAARSRSPATQVDA